MKAANLNVEPGLIPIFRLFLIVMLVLLGLGLRTSLNSSPPNVFNVAMWVYCALLLIYLSWRPITRWLGTRWLPIALWVASLAPIFIEAAANSYYLRGGVSAGSALLDANRLYLWLLLPLLLVSAQYGLRALLAFSFGTALLPVLLALPAARLLPFDSIVTGAFVRLLLYTTAGYIVMRITSASRAQRRELAEKNAQITRFAATLEQLAVARERNRLARELHDTLAHTLSAVNVQLKALDVLMETDPVRARAALHDTQALTRSGLEEARRALGALRSRPIDELGLGLALGELARKAVERAGLALTLDVPSQIAGLRPEVEQTLYRIVEEALNNVVRHANARHLTLTWQEKAGVVTLIVRDDGAGFAPTTAHDGRYGLVGMRERALLIDAQIDVISSAGRGTEIRVQFQREEQ